MSGLGLFFVWHEKTGCCGVCVAPEGPAAWQPWTGCSLPYLKSGKGSSRGCAAIATVIRLTCVLSPVLFGYRQGVGLQAGWIFGRDDLLSSAILSSDSFIFFLTSVPQAEQRRVVCAGAVTCCHGPGQGDRSCADHPASGPSICVFIRPNGEEVGLSSWHVSSSEE